MFLLPIVLSWAKGFTVRQWIEAGAAVAVVIFILYWDHLEIQKGRDECAASQVAAQAATESRVRAESAALAPYLDRYNALTQALANNAPPQQTDHSCANAAADVVRRANAQQ